MIFDEIGNLQRYDSIPFVKDVLGYISSRDCSQVPDGEHEILGRDLFVRVAEYETGSANMKQFEAHSVYADLQYVVRGGEVMDVSLEKNPVAVTAYDSSADIRFFRDPQEILSVPVTAGHFTVFYPGELHKPGCLAGPHPEKVKKLVFKIRIARG